MLKRIWNRRADENALCNRLSMLKQNAFKLNLNRDASVGLGKIVGSRFSKRGVYQPKRRS